MHEDLDDIDNLHRLAKNDDLQIYNASEEGHTKAQNELENLTTADWESNSGWSPLKFAAANGFTNVVKKLVRECKVDPNTKEDGDHWTLLHWAVFGGHREVAKVLLRDFDSNVDARDFFGRTPVYMAVENGDTEVTIMLAKEFHADVTISDVLGYTPLHKAVKEGQIDMVRILVELGTDVNTKDNYDSTPLHFAAN
jgi:ankyrin repeat protein